MGFRYGDSWEKFPIRAGEMWIEESSGSQLAVWDIFDGLPAFMLNADLIYCDPPWDTGNLRSFYTKAGKGDRPAFESFAEVLFARLMEIGPPACYLEIGGRNLEVFLGRLAQIYLVVQSWPVTYYRKNPSWLVRGGHERCAVDFSGMDDIDTPRLALESERFSCVADLCMGRGLTAVTAYNLGKRFVGTELYRRRLACAIEKVAKAGGKWSITQL